MTNFTRLTAGDVRRHPGPAVADRRAVGPPVHEDPPTALGAIDFGVGAEIDLPRDRAGMAGFRAGSRYSHGPAAPVRIFVMGRNQWRDEQEWPLARTLWTSYLSTRGANSSRGDGRLSTEAEPHGATSDTFSYDPADPVPFISDHASSSQIGGPDDYGAVEERADVLVYSTAELGTRSRSPARSGSGCGPRRQRRTRTSPLSCSTYIPTVSSSGSATAWCGPASVTGTGARRNCSSPAR